jgi:hypothetical protein
MHVRKVHIYEVYAHKVCSHEGGMRCTSLRYTPMRYTPVRYTSMRHTPIRYTPVRDIPMRQPPIRCTLVGCTSVRYKSVRLSLFYRSDWLANPLPALLSPSHPCPFVDSLDSELWCRFGCRAAALASAAPRPLGSLFGSFSPRGARSKGDQQPDGRIAHNQEALNILGVDIGILATRVQRARKTRK